MILKDSIKILIIAGCSVWCRFLGCIFFGFRLGSMVMYFCISQSNSFSKFCGGGWREAVDCVGW